MSGWLLDTNVLSELRRPKPAKPVVDFMDSKPLNALFVSEVTFSEIRFGIVRLDASELRTRLEDWLQNTLRPRFATRTLPVNEEVVFIWLVPFAQARRARRAFSQPDLLIAATALHYGLTVVTRDTKDFQKARVPVLDPWG